MDSSPAVSVASRRRRTAAWIAGAGVTAVVSGLIVYASLRETELDRYWKAMLDDRSDVLFCVEQPLRIYMFDGPRTDELNEKMVGTSAVPPANADLRHKTELNLSELKGAGDRYYSVGDYLASVSPGGVSGTQGQSVPDHR